MALEGQEFGDISIHAPVKGATTRDDQVLQGAHEFQSTHP